MNGVIDIGYMLRILLDAEFFSLFVGHDFRKSSDVYGFNSVSIAR